ncbi:hypothetical protein Bca101_006274 [Brassica carinata]
MLLSNNTITPENIWNATWKILSTDISRNERKKMDNTNLNFSEVQIKNLALAEIESLMRINGSSFTIFKI